MLRALVTLVSLMSSHAGDAAGGHSVLANVVDAALRVCKHGGRSVIGLPVPKAIQCAHIGCLDRLPPQEQTT